MPLLLLPHDVIAALTRVATIVLWAALALIACHDLLALPTVRRLRWRARYRLGRLVPALRKEPPAMGYLNRVIDLQFPDLAGLQEDSDRAVIWLKIRNPKLMTGNDVLTENVGNVQFGPDGEPIGGNVKKSEVLKSMARLVIAGFVWDATVDSDDPPLIPMPPTPEDAGRMPISVLNAIADEMKKTRPK